MVRFPTRSGFSGALIALLIVACSGINSPITYPLSEGDKDGTKSMQYASAPPMAGWGLPEVASGAKPSRLNLPAKESDLAPSTRSGALMKSLSPGARSALMYQGFVTRGANHVRISEAYAAAAAAHQPALITLDTLARETARTLQALGEDLDRSVAVPAVHDFLVASTDALERMVLPVELEASRRELLVVLCTARKLSDAAYQIPGVVLAGANAERLRSGATGDDDNAARAYLTAYRFRLDGDVGAQRMHLRTAWLLGNLLRDAHQEILSRTWRTNLDRGTYWFGRPRGLTPLQLADMANSAGLPPGDVAHASDVTRVDAWRETMQAAPGSPKEYSLFGRYLAPDDEVLARALAPRVPSRKRASSLDVAYVFGSPGALLDVELLGRHDTAQYTAALDPLRHRMATATSAHESVYASWLSAMRAMTLRSHSAVAEPYATSPTHDARLTQSALAAWTAGRGQLEWGDAGGGTMHRSAAAFAELDAMVELHPEAIANLAATLEQARRAAKQLAGGAPLSADAMVEATATLLRACLQAANARAQGTALDDGVSHELSHAAERLDYIDAQGEALGISASLQARNEVDLGPHIASWDLGTGTAREGLFLIPDPITGKWVLHSGVVIPHEEGSTSMAEHPMVATYFVGEK